MMPTGFFARRWWLAAAFLLLPAGAARAQLAPDSARLAVKLAVARLFSRAYEVEAEYRWARQLSLTLAPRLVTGTVPGLVSPDANAAGDQVRGSGLGVGARFYFPSADTRGAKLAGFYFGLRAEFQHLRLRYQQPAWGEDLAPDGLLYYTFRPRDFSETIRRYGGAATLGYQCQAFHPRVRLDLSASLQRFQSRSSAGDASRYRSSRTDYGASDPYLTVDLGLGFVVK